MPVEPSRNCFKGIGPSNGAGRLVGIVGGRPLKLDEKSFDPDGIPTNRNRARGGSEN